MWNFMWYFVRYYQMLCQIQALAWSQNPKIPMTFIRMSSYKLEQHCQRAIHDAKTSNTFSMHHKSVKPCIIIICCTKCLSKSFTKRKWHKWLSPSILYFEGLINKLCQPKVVVEAREEAVEAHEQHLGRGHYHGAAGPNHGESSWLSSALPHQSEEIVV